jgi:hypothetical protein
MVAVPSSVGTSATSLNDGNGYRPATSEMARKRINATLRRQVLTEAGYRCAVPTCRNILALDLHHIVSVRERGANEPGNLIALCPTCHGLHERGEIPAEAIEAYKSILVALTAAFDRAAIDQLMFLTKTDDDRRRLVVSGDGVTRFASLIGAGYADYRLLGSDRYGTVYKVELTPRGAALVNAWKSGRRSDVEAALQLP